MTGMRDLTPAEYAAARSAALAAARTPPGAPALAMPPSPTPPVPGVPGVPKEFNARTAEAKDYASSKQAIIAAALRRDR